jgi:4-amino-4-deoxy-L-arabinose transferase-like glycosyltransferase
MNAPEALSSPAGALRLPQLGRLARATIVLVALAAIVAGGAALRFDRAAHPQPANSADERAYLTLARDIARTGNYGGPGTEMDDPLHWPPGAPALFALAQELSPGPEGELAPRSIYRAQAIVGTLAILVAFGVGALLAGAPAGLAAAAATAFYPPLVDASGRALSEPFAALALVIAVLGCAWAARRPSQPWRFAIAGLLIGGTLLVRADLGAALPLVALWAAWVAARGATWRRGALCAALLLAGTLVAIVPWAKSASDRAGRLVPVSTSGGSAIYVGTYLPGDGSMYGLKRSLGNQLRLQDPRLGAVPNFRLPQERLLDMVAARHPELDREAALQKEARHNLDVYAKGEPLRFAAMMARKGARMWTTPTRGRHAELRTGRHVVHVLLVGLALIGTLLGAFYARRPGFGAILAVALASTLINALFLSEPRHLLPLLPALFGTGAAGWVLAVRRRRAASAGVAQNDDRDVVAGVAAGPEERVPLESRGDLVGRLPGR